MGLPSEYAYLVGTLPFLLVAAIVYYFHPKLRREMVLIAILWGILSPLTAYFYWTKDWWHPATITGTPVGIEDVLLGIGAGALAAVLYEVVFYQHLKVQRRLCTHCPGTNTFLLLLAFVTTFGMAVSGLTSFFASSLAFLIVAVAMFVYRRDLLVNGMLTGFFLALFSFLGYGAAIAVDPSFIQHTYYFEYLSGYDIQTVPIEEFVFWFLSGLVFGPWYEYWQGERTRGKSLFGWKF